MKRNMKVLNIDNVYINHSHRIKLFFFVKLIYKEKLMKEL